MNALDVPEIPQDYVNFAKEIAELAKKYDLDGLKLEMTPGWRKQQETRINGAIAINYSRSDQRGRPCENLNISLNTTLVLGIVQTAPSYD